MAKKIDELIFRALDGKASAEELRFLSDWVKEKDQRSYFLSLKKLWNILSGPHITQERKARELRRYLNSIHRIRNNSRKRRIRTWSKYAAVLFFPVILFFCIFQFRNHEELSLMADNSVPPGISQAVLTMASGETVLLSCDDSVDFHLEEVVRVKSGKKGIVYESTENKKEETSYNILSVPRGGEYSIVLSDGTKVYLNSESRLKYPVRFTSGLRKVQIEGEGYFEVAPDKEHPFVVQVEEMEIKVTGTSFNVQGYRNEVQRVTLVEGEVVVTRREQQKVIRPGEQLVIEDNDLILRQVEVKPYIAWKDQRFVFIDDHLEEVLRKLERWYNVQFFIQDEEVRGFRFTGNLPKYEMLDKVLEKLELTTHIYFLQEGHTVVVRKE